MRNKNNSINYTHLEWFCLYAGSDEVRAAVAKLTPLSPLGAALYSTHHALSQADHPWFPWYRSTPPLGVVAEIIRRTGRTKQAIYHAIGLIRGRIG